MFDCCAHRRSTAPTDEYLPSIPVAQALDGCWRWAEYVQPRGGAALPSQITLQVVSLDANTQQVYYRFKLVLKVGGDGSYSGIKKWKKNVIPNTLQMFLVEPRGDAIPAGTVVSLCIEVVKKKASAPVRS